MHSRTLSTVMLATLAIAATVPYAIHLGHRHAANERIRHLAFREIAWTALTPADWKPVDVLKGLDVNRLSDADPQAIDALAQMRSAWANAPTVNALDGAAVRIAGFVIPLDRVDDTVHEFLLLPYFGACIHVPPPPPNQIIYVTSTAPLTNMMTMDAMWVDGILKVSTADSPWGRSAYRLEAVRAAPYTIPGRPS
jgi:uncharacterized protein